MSAGRVDRIRALLEHAFAPVSLVVTDDSEAHTGHAGAAGGAGHYRVEIVSAAFSGKSALARHRLVYGALAGMMPGDIHALAIAARAPGEGPTEPGPPGA